MAKIKGNNGGTNGDSGAPAEAHAAEVQQQVESVAETPTQPAVGIPPDAQAVASPAATLSTMSLAELKAAQEVAHLAVEVAEKRLAESISAERAIEHARCLRYQETAKEQGKRRAIVMIDGKRMAVKKRNNSEMLQLVSAEVDDAIQA